MIKKNFEVLTGNGGTKNCQFDLIRPCCFNRSIKEIFMRFSPNQWVKKKWILLLPFLLAACGMPTTKLPMQSVSAFKSIMVVAIEPPPLEVIPDLLESRIPAYRHFHNMELLPFSEQKLYRYPGDVLIAGQVTSDDVVEIESLENAPGMPSPEKNRPVLFKQRDKWMPTFELASAAAEYLTQNKFQATAGAHILPLSVGMPYLGRWREAVGQWYESNVAQTDYKSFSVYPVDAVIEIGISQYRIFQGQFSLQVLIKVIDPIGKKVLAKTNQADYSFGSSAQALLEPDGAAFKALVRTMGTCLLNQGFQDIGLIPVDPQVGKLPDNTSYCSL